jgi:Asp-tRNA(Asn)/Glu-tRNA(Gln) amidotransferase C subunit
MKEINKQVLKDAAKRLLFDMSEEEYDTLLKEFDVITKQMDLIGQIEGIDNHEPMTFPFVRDRIYAKISC